MILRLLERVGKGGGQFLSHHGHNVIVVLLETLDILVVFLDLLERVTHAQQSLVDPCQHLPQKVTTFAVFSCVSWRPLLKASYS